MAKLKTEYDLLISCPGDVEGEVELIKRIAEKFNDTYSDILSIRLNTKHWSNSSYNQSGGKAQELLNKQFIHKCDAAVAVFWTRFGAPTDKYGSGTEEEIEDMLAAGKQVFLYFCEKPIDPKLLLDDTARAQYQKVKDYQNKYSDEGKGIYAKYASDKEFEEKLFAHLSLHFLTAKKVEELKGQRKSLLKIKGIENGNLYNQFFVSDFVPNGGRVTATWLSEISSMYDTIAAYSVTAETSEMSNAVLQLAFSRKKVELHENAIKLIKLMAERLEISLPEHFFSLGNLQENSIAVSTIMSGSRSFYGTHDEKEKYNKLIRLYHEIEDLLGWVPFDNVYTALPCVKLAVSNEGTTFDEDIDVALRISKNDILIPKQLPIPTDCGCESIIKNYSLSELFGIPSTQYYNDYDSSKRTLSSPAPYSYHPDTIGLIGTSRDYEEEYREGLENAFEYAFFEDGEDIIVKLHIDYLKHNTAVAFPTVLFVSKELSSFSYTIRSKQNEQETVGKIEIGEQHEA